MKNMKKCLALLLALLLALSLAACGGDSSPPVDEPPPSRIWSRIPLSTPTTAAFWALG